MKIAVYIVIGFLALGCWVMWKISAIRLNKIIGKK